MPELPEVESTARQLRGRLVGAHVVGVSGVDWPRMLPETSEAALNAALNGRRIVEVGRRGKYLLLCFDGGVAVTIHRKMSGNLLLKQKGAVPDPHTHLVISLDDGTELRFVDARKFGRVSLFPEQAALDAFLAERLGPDALEELTPAALKARLATRSGAVKSVLLDQSFAAGIGNLYADEALWDAQLHPLRRANTLSDAEIQRVAQSIRRVLTQGIERRGTSFSSYRGADGEPGENQHALKVYGRGPSRGHTGKPCLRCETPIQTLRVGQRTSHYCPACQPPAA